VDLAKQQAPAVAGLFAPLAVRRDTPFEMHLKFKFRLGAVLHGEIVGWISFQPLTMWLRPPISLFSAAVGEKCGLA
jgi:hypothetical protein